METVVCATCGQEKPIKRFRRLGKQGGTPLCRACDAKAYAQKPEVKEKARVYQKDRYKTTDAVQSRRAYMKDYNQRPYVKEKIIEYRKLYYERPGVKEKKMEYQRELIKRPDFKEKRKKYNQNPNGIEARRIWAKSEKGIAYRKKHNQKPEVKEYYKIYKQKPEAKQKEKIYKQKPEVKEMYRIASMKPHRKQYQKNYMQNPEVKERLNVYSRQRRRDVADIYAKSLICQRTNGALRFKDIPPELIELQRQSIKLKRTIKQKNKEDEQHDTTDI
jgi:hypothetical protein